MQPVKTESIIPNHAVLRHLRRDGVAISPTGQTIKTMTTRRLFHVLPTVPCFPCFLPSFCKAMMKAAFAPVVPWDSEAKTAAYAMTQTAHQCTTWRSFCGCQLSMPSLCHQIQMCWSGKTSGCEGASGKNPKLKHQANICKYLLKITNPSPFLVWRLWRFQGNWTLGSTEALAERPRESLPQTVLVLLAGGSKGKMMEDWQEGQERILTYQTIFLIWNEIVE